MQIETTPTEPQRPRETPTIIYYLADPDQPLGEVHLTDDLKLIPLCKREDPVFTPWQVDYFGPCTCLECLGKMRNQ